jgi:hypothetical protein
LRLQPLQPHSTQAQIGALGETRQPPIAYLLSSKSLSGIPYRISRRPVSLSQEGQLSFMTRMLERRTDTKSRLLRIQPDALFDDWRSEVHNEKLSRLAVWIHFAISLEEKFGKLKTAFPSFKTYFAVKYTYERLNEPKFVSKTTSARQTINSLGLSCLG